MKAAEDAYEALTADQKALVPEEMKKKSKNNETEAAETSADVSYEDLVNQEINFGNYSKIVDEFFALLEGEV